MALETVGESSISVLGAVQSELAFPVPDNACDCHVHVFGDPGEYPLSKDRRYMPGLAPVQDLLRLHKALGISRTVVVQPSCYGTDNSCTLDAIRHIGASARGIAVIDPDTVTAEELRKLDHAGIRGVRVNLETAGEHDPAVAVTALRKAAGRVHELGWHVQTYASLEMIASLYDHLLALPAPIVVDHFGRARRSAQPGFDALLALVGSGKAYVKISAAYRIGSDPDYANAEEVAQSLIAANPDRVVWGTDWPHPGMSGQPRSPDAVEAFRPEDNGRALNRLFEWAANDIKLRKILVDNPARLYGF